MQIVNNIALITINETLIFQLVSFLIFLWVMNRVMFRPLREVMAEREDVFEKTQEETNNIISRYDDLRAQIDLQEDQARQSSFELKSQIEAAGAGEAKAIMSDARKQIEGMHEESRAILDEKIRRAREGLAPEAEALAVLMIEKLLGRRLGA